MTISNHFNDRIRTFVAHMQLRLDSVDPYALHRIMLYKALFVATIEVYIYWIFRPANFISFFSPSFLVVLYEAPVLATFKQREQLLIFISIAIILISVSFYLVYPFRVTFFFFSTIVLSITYFYILKHFYMLKNLTMLLLATGALILETQPPANLQIAYSFVSSIFLSMTTALICLRIVPNMYLIVWNRALQHFIQCLEIDISRAITQSGNQPTAEQILHLGMIRNFRRLIPPKYLMQAYRISVNIRNIQLALDNLYYESKNELFWYGIKNNLEVLRSKMKNYTPCSPPQMPMEPETQLQSYVMYCLVQTFTRWNKLCFLRNQ